MDWLNEVFNKFGKKSFENLILDRAISLRERIAFADETGFEIDKYEPVVIYSDSYGTNEWQFIFKLTRNSSSRYFAAEVYGGSYDSYEINDWYEVEPVEMTITKWRRR